MNTLYSAKRFDFVPRLLLVQKPRPYFASNLSYTAYWMIAINGITEVIMSTNGSFDRTNTISWGGQTVSWYSGGSEGQYYQLNASGTVYRYIVIG